MFKKKEENSNKKLTLHAPLEKIFFLSGHQNEDRKHGISSILAVSRCEVPR